MNVQPFPCAVKTLPISVTTSASASTALPGQGTVLRLINEGAVMVFVAVGEAAQTATLPNATPTATSTPVLPGSDIVLSLPSSGIWNISAITRSSTATLHVQVGDGI